MGLSQAYANRPFLNHIEASRRLPSLPGVLVRLIEVCNRDETTFREVSRIIEKDPVLTAKVLRMVNSVHVGLAQPVEGVEGAVVLLGIDAVKNIAICSGVHQVFGQVKGNSVFKMKVFWWHSLSCAVLTRLIAQRIRYAAPDEAFLCGLLHDLGKLVLWTSLPDEYAAILQEAEHDPETLPAAEARLGAGHAEAGAWLLRRWKLKSFMADAVLYHHESLDRIRHALPLTRIVYSANVLDPTGHPDREKAYEAAKLLLDLSRGEVEDLLARSVAETRHVAQSLEIDVEPPAGAQESLSRSDEKHALALAQEIENLSLLYSTARDLLGAANEAELLRAVHQGMQAVFEVTDVLIFLYDEECDCLRVRPSFGDLRGAESNLVIPVTDGNSLLLDGLISENPVDSFNRPQDAPLSIQDEQILRLMVKGGMICLPMKIRKEPVGVLVLGVDEMERTDLMSRTKILSLFAAQAALALYVHRLHVSRMRLVQSERLAAASAVARKVVHEVNNPLGIIKNYLRILGMKLPEQDAVQGDLRLIHEEINRVTRIITQLSNFSESRSRQLERVDLNALLSSLVRFATESFKDTHKLQFHLDLDESIPSLYTDKDGLKQVFVNLLKNSMEAMPKGGNLTIRSRALMPPQIQGRQEFSTSPTTVEILFSDDGPGIPESIRATLFEPYVSTKDPESRGLGLSIVHNIIRENEGSIECESESGAGTTFRILLPIKVT